MNETLFPCLGAAYYPEDWPDEELEKDVAKMREKGIKIARIAEFAWHRMEPKEGEYDFSFFRRVIDTCKKYGVSVIFGTPTATPPVWLGRTYPDVYSIDENGHRHSHGGRRDCCSNNPNYVRASLKITEEIAKTFGAEEAIVGWQIDNEIYIHGAGCFCPHCISGFRAWLKERYHTVDALNEAWNLNLFSQWYDSFDDVPAPHHAWHNPHLIAAWREFQTHSHAVFVAKQAEILHRYTKAPVGTDLMPVAGMDHREMLAALDVAQFNHYNNADDLADLTFWYDMLRPISPRPLWNTETSTTWNGSTAISQAIKPDGWCRANSMLPITLGGEANLYWLWRTHWAGHELQHGAVIDTTGRDFISDAEVRRTAKELEIVRDFVNGTTVRPDFAIHFDFFNYRMSEAQPIVQNNHHFTELIHRFYKPATELGLRADVIDSLADPSAYPLVISTEMMTLERDGLAEKMKRFVENGGVWVVGPMSDVRNIDGARYRDRYYGILEELTGARWCYSVPDPNGDVTLSWNDGSAFDHALWVEVCDADPATALATVTKGHSALIGKAVLSRIPVGKGVVYLLGTLPSPETFRKILRLAARDAGITLPELTGKLVVSPRTGTDEGLCITEIGGQTASYTLSAPMKDLVTGEQFTDTVPFEPFGVRFLRKI